MQPQHKNLPIVRDAILYQYKAWDVPANASQRQEALDGMTSDFTFLCTTLQFGDFYAAKGANVYYYYFTHFSTQQSWPQWMGVIHESEIPFVFGQPLNVKDWKYNDAEKELGKRFMRYWANFARTGDPNINPDGSKTPNNWPLYNKDKAYIELTTGGSSTGTGLRNKNCQFWNDYIPKLMSAASTQDVSQAEQDWKKKYDEWQTRYNAFQLLHPITRK